MPPGKAVYTYILSFLDFFPTEVTREHRGQLPELYSRFSLATYFIHGIHSVYTHTHTCINSKYTHTHTHIYIYINPKCVCVCILRVYTHTHTHTHTQSIPSIHTHTHTMEYYSAIRRNKIGSFAKMWMDLETAIQSEISQKEQNKYHILMNICGI